MELADLLRALRQRWWLLVTGLVLVGALALTSSLLATPRYTTSMQFFVTTSGSASVSDVYESSQFSEARVTSYARLLVGEALARQVIVELDLDERPGQLVERITATAVPDTVLIDVTVSDRSPRQAERIATTLAEAFLAQVAALEAADGTSPVRVAMTDPPEAPSVASAPLISRNVALGAVIGLFLGAGAAIALARFDRSIRGSQGAADATRAPVLGLVLEDPKSRTRPTIDPACPTPRLEDFRRIAAQLLSLADGPSRTIMVSSAMPLKETSAVVVNLGLVLAEAGRAVSIIDADLRQPRVGELLGISAEVGLRDVLAGDAPLGDVVRVHDGSGIRVVPAGRPHAGPARFLASARMAEVLKELHTGSDFVLVDVPAVLAVSDATLVALHADAVLLVVEHGHSRTDHVEQAVSDLERVGARLLGVVITRVPSKTARTGDSEAHDRSGSTRPRRTLTPKRPRRP